MTKCRKYVLTPFAVWLGSVSAFADPVPAPRLTVNSLFTELICGTHAQANAEPWQAFGLKSLLAWPQEGAGERAKALMAYRENAVHVPVPPLTGKPVRLTDEKENRAFFLGVPEEGIPRDGSWIGFKYVFYPDACGLPERAGGTPIAFFLVQPAPAHLTEADLQLALSPQAEDTLLEQQINGYRSYQFACRSKRGLTLQNEALPLMQIAAAAGFCQAQYALGLHELRKETPRAMETARELFRLAANQELPDGEIFYAGMLEGGNGGPKDLDTARTYALRALDHGVSRKLETLLVLVLTGCDENPERFEARRSLLRKNADAGDRRTQFDFAHLLRLGIGGPANPEEARFNYQRAADQGHAMAQCALADMLKAGEGGLLQLEAARKYYQQSADQFNRRGQYEFARMLYLGQGGAVDQPSARVYFQRAAERGEGMALLYLAEMLRDGLGGPADPVAAGLYAQRAAELGLPEVQPPLPESREPLVAEALSPPEGGQEPGPSSSLPKVNLALRRAGSCS